MSQSHEKYQQDFPKNVRERALQHALDIRKFEIELYWKRSTYFWALIGVALAGYGAVQNLEVEHSRERMSLVVSALGAAFSLAWYLANRGSKQWHENWENHVDLLEDEFIGPLHKTVLRRPEPADFWQRLRLILTGPGAYSVSKINQLVSCFVVLLWVVLLCSHIRIDTSASVDWVAVGILTSLGAMCVAMLLLGKTDKGNHSYSVFRRQSRIESGSDAAARDTTIESDTAV